MSTPAQWYPMCSTCHLKCILHRGADWDTSRSWQELETGVTLITSSDHFHVRQDAFVYRDIERTIFHSRWHIACMSEGEKMWPVDCGEPFPSWCWLRRCENDQRQKSQSSRTYLAVITYLLIILSSSSQSELVVTCNKGYKPRTRSSSHMLRCCRRKLSENATTSGEMPPHWTLFTHANRSCILMTLLSTWKLI